MSCLVAKEGVSHLTEHESIFRWSWTGRLSKFAVDMHGGLVQGHDLPAGASWPGESSRGTLVSWRVDFLLQPVCSDLIGPRGLDLSFKHQRLHPPHHSGEHTFFKILSPSPSATAIAFLRELACSMRSLIDDPVGQVYTNTTTSDPG